MSLSFDTLGFAKRLRDAGVEPSHAEAHAEAARDFIMADLVTKSDLRNALLTQTVAFGTMLAVAVGVIVTLIKL